MTISLSSWRPSSLGAPGESESATTSSTVNVAQVARLASPGGLAVSERDVRRLNELVRIGDLTLLLPAIPAVLSGRGPF
jgi:hypothetical protein